VSRQIAAPVTLAVLGAGGRGAEAYGRWALEHADEARVVAVAEPDEGRRARFAQGHSLDGQNVFDDWRKLVGAGRLADAIVIATPDRLHVEPTIAALELGYEVLLEKPIAPTEHELDRLGEAAAHGRGSITVAHVLRYTPFFAKIRELLDDGRIGELVGITHHENIGYWHFAHSFVRGSWRQTDEASPMLLAKACHDLDLMSWFAGAACVSVASAGGLHHFRAENAPPGAPARCTDGCPVADDCAFYAPRFYVERLAGVTGMPLSAVTTDPTLEGRLRALREGSYGHTWQARYRRGRDAPLPAVDGGPRHGAALGTRSLRSGCDAGRPGADLAHRRGANGAAAPRTVRRTWRGRPCDDCRLLPRRSSASRRGCGPQPHLAGRVAGQPPYRLRGRASAARATGRLPRRLDSAT
jgi:predicted dehydrogenase